MVKKSPKRWMYSLKASPKSQMPESVKQTVQARCDEFVEQTLKPRFIQPPPANPQFNYIAELYNRWYRNSFYFCARYRCPAPNCISEFFEVRYTRLEYIAPNLFALAYMRHTDKWQVVYPGLSLDDAILTITNEPIFHP